MDDRINTTDIFVVCIVASGFFELLFCIDWIIGFLFDSDSFRFMTRRCWLTCSWLLPCCTWAANKTLERWRLRLRLERAEVVAAAAEAEAEAEVEVHQILEGVKYLRPLPLPHPLAPVVLVRAVQKQQHQNRRTNENRRAPKRPAVNHGRYTLHVCSTSLHLRDCILIAIMSVAGG